MFPRAGWLTKAGSSNGPGPKRDVPQVRVGGSHPGHAIVYTVEGIRAAWQLVAPGGRLTIDFSVFGSTWIVNASVFFGVLVMVLLANVMVDRFAPDRLLPWFIPLLASVGVVILVDQGMLNQYGVVTRGVLGGLLIGLPVAFAGAVVSMLLARSRNASASLASNLLGALVGGAWSICPCGWACAPWRLSH